MERASTTNGPSKTDARKHEMCGGRGTVTVVLPTSNVHAHRRAGAMVENGTPLPARPSGAWG